MSSVSRVVDERMLRRALALATLGSGTAAPNPCVGAVVARGDRVIGQGFHLRPGSPHAEAVALLQVALSGQNPRGATLYTNLEPCCHIGRTPPCVDEILRSGIARVVASMRDPNPRVDGGGVRALRLRGVQVEVGLLKSEAMRLNQAFVKLCRTGIPWVTLKAAMSLDGRTATRTGSSKWITSASARRHARLLRAEHQAILAGIGTILADDPRLDRRPELPGAQPLLRVVLDSRLRLSTTSRLVESRSRGPILVFCAPGASASKRRRLEASGLEVQALPRRGGGGLDLKRALRSLGARGIGSVLVEGGSELHGSFLDRRLADRLVLYLAPRILGGHRALPLVGGTGSRLVEDALRLEDARWSEVGDGWLIEGSFPNL